ncbi:MAG: pyridoxal-phosphate dependent enzyme [Pseudomonadota bacterium]
MISLSLERIDATLEANRQKIRKTPALTVPAELAPTAASVSAKFELHQITGTFKARAALANVREQLEAVRKFGVTAVSAGNHAIATAYAAASVDANAKVVMTATAPKIRVQRCEALGAEVVLAPDVHQAFDIMENIVRSEHRTMIHPFEGETTALGTAGVGREFALDCPDLDAVIVPIGGGGLAAGVAAAIKQTLPACAVYGVEPFGADSMSRSRALGEAVTLDSVNTIADSLGAPMALPISFDLCQQFVDDVVCVSDDELREAMLLQHRYLGLAVEPACASATAAARGPLAERLQGKHVGLIFCGSNIDHNAWHRLVSND